jgi:hypothetical protein
MTLLPAWTLALYGIGFIAAFGAWKITVAPRLARRRVPATT